MDDTETFVWVVRYHDPWEDFSYTDSVWSDETAARERCAVKNTGQDMVGRVIRLRGYEVDKVHLNPEGEPTYSDVRLIS